MVNVSISAAENIFDTVASSSNPFVETVHGITRLFTEVRKTTGRLERWIEFQNEHGFSTQQRVSAMYFSQII